MCHFIKAFFLFHCHGGYLIMRLFYGTQQTGLWRGFWPTGASAVRQQTLQGLIGNLLFACKKEMGIKFRELPPCVTYISCVLYCQCVYLFKHLQFTQDKPVCHYQGFWFPLTIATSNKSSNPVMTFNH